MGYLREAGNYQGSGDEVDSEGPLARLRVRRLGLPAIRLALSSLCSIAGHRSDWWLEQLREEPRRLLLYFAANQKNLKFGMHGAGCVNLPDQFTFVGVEMDPQ